MRVFTSLALILTILGCDRAPQSASPPPATVTPEPQRQQATALPRLRVDGTRFARPDGSRFHWRGISAFRLVEMVAHGREADAAAYLDWAAARELTVVRVFTMAHHLFGLTPTDGVAALPRLLEMAAQRQMYVEVVALADTAAIQVDLAQHVKRVGEIASRHTNAVVEIANEPVHPTQRREVHDTVVVRQLASAVPPGVPVSLGSIERGAGFGEGSYLTWHVPRSTDHGGWGHVLAIAEGPALLAKWKKPVVNDEPIGAAAEYVAGRRDNDPARFRAAALVTRLAGLGATFHYEGGLQARIPSGRELECFDAWNEAWRLLPQDVAERGAFRRAGEDGSAVAAFDAGAAAAVFERRTEKDAWVVAVGVSGDPALRPSNGWRTAQTERAPGVLIVRLMRD